MPTTPAVTYTLKMKGFCRYLDAERVYIMIWLTVTLRFFKQSGIIIDVLTKVIIVIPDQ